jgi:hypothetical protein
VLALSLALGACSAATSELDDGGGLTGDAAPTIGDGGLDGGANTTDDAGVTGTGPFCEVVARVFVPRCTVCHKPGGSPPDLTFDGAQRDLVGVATPTYPGTTRVVAGSRERSLLWRKVTGTQAANEGLPMPTGTSGLPAELQAIVGAWIDSGAPTTCESLPQVDAGTAMGYHPAGYAAPEVHGAELKLQVQDCRSCHGNELNGGAGPSCDGCHQAGWRTNCTFCHGGTDTMTGAPPRELRGTIDRDRLVFRPHTEHTTERNHAAWDCNQCHLKPSDVLSMNHVFDSTAGAAEVDFSGGLSPTATYAAGACSSLYCHGNGRTSNGQIEHTAARPGCDGCHPSMTTRTRWRQMSGEHAGHLREGITCGECHAGTANAQGTGIAGVALHVNGQKDLQFTAAGFARSAAGTCQGSCHGETHRGRSW